MGLAFSLREERVSYRLVKGSATGLRKSVGSALSLREEGLAIGFSKSVGLAFSLREERVSYRL